MPKNPTLIAIGLWHSTLEPTLPDPAWFVDEHWDEQEKQAVLQHLQNSYALPYPYAGKSWCRFACGEREMGNEDMTDGTYLWPSGLPHYILHHNVKLPQIVLQTMLSTPITRYNFAIDFSVDMEWWEIQKGWAKGKTTPTPIY